MALASDVVWSVAACMLVYMGCELLCLFAVWGLGFACCTVTHCQMPLPELYSAQSLPVVIGV